MRCPYSRLNCHAVWSTQERAHLITKSVEPRIHGAIRAKLSQHKFIPIAIGGMLDHIHCLFGFPPTILITYIVQQIKSSSSHLATRELALPQFE